MDFVEFAERESGVELFAWQKDYLRKIEELYKQAKDDNVDVRIVVLPRQVGRMYTYFKLEELLSNVSQNDSKH